MGTHLKIVSQPGRSSWNSGPDAHVGSKGASLPGKGWGILLIFIVALSLAGCATRMGVRQEEPRDTYAQIAVSALSADDYSRFSHDVLSRFDLVDAFEKDPGTVLTTLHRKVVIDSRSDTVFALAELSYLAGLRKRHEGGSSTQPIFFASVFYAYQYLFGNDGLEPPNPHDRRFRLACDLYNSALAEALTDTDGNMRIAPDGVVTNIGRFGFTLDATKFHQDLATIEKFVSADRFTVQGFSRRNRDAGLGAPVIAIEKRPEGAPMFKSSPGTVFLRFNFSLFELGKGDGEATLELYSAFDNTQIEVGGNVMPLERDSTAQLAYQVDQPYVQSLGFREFLFGTGYVKTGIFPLQPYDPHKMPIVLVHGTFSSPVAWGEMVNTLRADPLIAKKFQIWNFFYDSGKRIGISSHELRDALTRHLQTLDPAGVNPALQRMVVIGHSQGGLLTKMTATDTGDAIVRRATGKSLAELDLSDEERAHIQKESVFTRLPFVSRVVFISTPHRGSFLSQNWVRSLVLKVLTLPKDVLQSTARLMTAMAKLNVTEAFAQGAVGMSSLDVMSPKNPILLTIADIPLAPGVKGHSIVAIDGDETPPDGDDGVVKYTSAHVDYVESEFLVRHGHSCQSHPLVIEEVRRILLEHLRDNPQVDK
jgi:triacylglycerol esterase/lipase EstA (alpha/beta hydrolase family)